MSGGAMDRRGFCRTLPALAVGVGTLGTAACGGAAYLVPRSVGGRLVVSTADLAGATAVFLTHPSSDRPIFLHRAASGEWSAVHARCTHRGCQPEPVGERLVCPCHGSEFELDGALLEGPAATGLTRYPVAVDGTDVVVTVAGGGS
ncbi:MAG: Rieske (2Fe-2S) protein [Longimicrobiales bacterium]